MTSEASKTNCNNVLDAVEDFFCSPRFTSAIGDFMGQHALGLEFVDPAGEQPISNHTTFMKYQQLVESELSNFIAERGIEQQIIIEACQAALENGESEALMCVDYLLASTEYEYFMQLAYDHVQLSQYNPEAGDADDWTLPLEDDEEAQGAGSFEEDHNLQCQPVEQTAQ